MSNHLPHSPFAERNRDEIWSVLGRVLAGLLDGDAVLEIGSGTGQHAEAFAPRLVHGARWLPSDLRPRARAAIEARCRGIPSIERPVGVDTRIGIEDGWGVAARPVAAVVAINVVHIAPWQAVEGLFGGAARLLESSRGVLFFYGAFVRDGVPTAASNLQFDARLRRLNPAFGVRRLPELERVARRVGLELAEVHEMPNENCGVVFRPSSA